MSFTFILKAIQSREPDTTHQRSGILLRFLSLLLIGLAPISQGSFAAWDFRGDPNNWDQTRMTQVNQDLWVTQQTFTAGQTGFKIARDDGWNVSFPSTNFIVAPDATYTIRFFESSSTIQVENARTWNFRGTSNAWDESAMTSLGNGEHQICQDFSEGDNLGGPRFKVASEGWNLSFPAGDVSVPANTSQLITFNEFTQEIRTEQQALGCDGNAPAWHFRGTPNGWGETPLLALGNGQFETCQTFANGDELGGPRFKIASAAFGWDLAFPEQDVQVGTNQSLLITFDENTNDINTDPVASCSDPEGLTIVGQKTRLTLRNIAFEVTADILEVVGADEFSVNVFAGENYSVDNGFVVPSNDFVGDLHVSVNVETAEEVSPSFSFLLTVIDVNRDKNLIVHEQSLLGSNNSDISLLRFFNQLADTSNEGGLTGVQLFRQFWDAQNTPTEISVSPNCGDETLADGVTPSTNGFPVVCNRAEGNRIRGNDAQVLAEMASYFPIAAINRLDLQSADLSDCGEHRMIFARGNSNGFGRNFLIAEARIANPIPGEARGCLPIINFWLSLENQASNEAVVEKIEAAYFDGVENFPAIFSIDHFIEGSGQIRTNQFITPQWMLKEYKLAHDCSDNSCILRATPVSVKENPFGPLFDGNLGNSSSEFAQRAQDFQQNFLDNIDSLSDNNLGSFGIKTADVFNNGQSHASGQTLENDFNTHFNNGQNSAFFNQLNASMTSRLDANGNPLSTQQLLNRATALTCGGCHQPSSFRLSSANAIGAMRLPNGDVINRWPASAGFVHVSEFPFNGVFTLSSALTTVFLPIRESVLVNYLNDLAER